MARGKRVTQDAIAMILAEAEFSEDAEVAKRWDIGIRSIVRWRKSLDMDPQLACLVQIKKQLFCRSWVDDAAEVIKAAALETKRRIRTATTEEDAKVIHAIAGAAKIFGELNITYTALSENHEPALDIQSQPIKEIKAGT